MSHPAYMPLPVPSMVVRRWSGGLETLTLCKACGEPQLTESETAELKRDGIDLGRCVCQDGPCKEPPRPPVGDDDPDEFHVKR